MSKETSKDNGYRKLYTDAFGPIPKNCDIHHIDGNHFNNELSNLMVCPSDMHTWLHTPRRVNPWMHTINWREFAVILCENSGVQ